MKEKNIKEKTQQKKKMGLTTKIFVALIAGAILGIILFYIFFFHPSPPFFHPYILSMMLSSPACRTLQ